MNPSIPWDDFKGFTGCACNIPAGKEKAPQIIDLQSFYKTFVLEAGLSSIKYHKINLIVIQMIISYLYFWKVEADCIKS